MWRFDTAAENHVLDSGLVNWLFNKLTPGKILIDQNWMQWISTPELAHVEILEELTFLSGREEDIGIPISADGIVVDEHCTAGIEESVDGTTDGAGIRETVVVLEVGDNVVETLAGCTKCRQRGFFKVLCDVCFDDGDLCGAEMVADLREDLGRESREREGLLFRHFSILVMGMRFDAVTKMCRYCAYFRIDK